jgi:Na+-driven multidrug efflux pump
MQYVEYLELKESRESTKKALKHSKYAMYIAVISIILNLFFSESIFGIFGNQQKNTKTDQVLESQAKDEFEYQNVVHDKLNNQQMILEVQDSARHE